MTCKHRVKFHPPLINPYESDLNYISQTPDASLAWFTNPAFTRAGGISRSRLISVKDKVAYQAATQLEALKCGVEECVAQ